MADWIIKRCSKKLSKIRFQCLIPANGQTQEWLEAERLIVRGESWMPNIGEYPNVAVACSLSQILEVSCPKRYFLSPKACLGILRRARIRKKELPLPLKIALIRQAQPQNDTDNEKAVPLSKDKFTVDFCLNDQGGEIMDVSPVAATLRANTHQHEPIILQPYAVAQEVYGISADKSNSMLSDNPHSGVYKAETCRTLDTSGTNPSCNQGGMIVLQKSYCLQGNMLERQEKNGPAGKGVLEEVSYCLNTIDRHAVISCFEPRSKDGVPRIHGEIVPTLVASQSGGQRQPCIYRDEVVGTLMARDYKGVGREYVWQNKLRIVAGRVRRLTPLECERLQGLPDNWTEGGSDSARYKAIGNGMAQPCPDFIMQSLVRELKAEKEQNNEQNERNKENNLSGNTYGNDCQSA